MACSLSKSLRLDRFDVCFADIRWQIAGCVSSEGRLHRRRFKMVIRRPSVEELALHARAEGFAATLPELQAYQARIDATFQAYDRIDQLVEPKLPVLYPRDRGYRPSEDENPLGAWAWKCSVRGEQQGLLAGKRIALKDVIAVAGMPLMNGSAVMDGFTSDVDATVVTRILEAGGEIVGKAVCENFCFSGGSHTSYPAPVLNPHDLDRWAGGSSSGSAVVVANGECEMALGCDQGGSIREPSSYCGVFGLKPTYGLVPYTGIGSLEPTVDHVGPIAATVEDIARLLESIAGRDEFDARQAVTIPEIPAYSQRFDEGCKGIRIGVVTEGFGWPEASEEDVDDTVRSAARAFKDLGASVTEVSIPMHRDAPAIFTAVVIEGAWSTMIRDDGIGRGWLGYYDTNLVKFYGSSRRTRANDFPHTVKLVSLIASYMAERYHSVYYSKGQNLRRSLRAAYDAMLEEFDLLVMPTTPQKAIPFDSERSLADDLFMSLNMIQNTCGFDLTGHPALNVPCGLSDGLPVGLMLVGRHWDEVTILRAARAFEQTGLYVPRGS
jgi:amidase